LRAGGLKCSRNEATSASKHPGQRSVVQDVPTCAAVWDTVDETHQNFQEAPAAHPTAMREVGELAPEPHSSVNCAEGSA